jgi:hypothetical protein
MFHMIRYSLPQYVAGCSRAACGLRLADCGLLTIGLANEVDTHILQPVTFQVPGSRFDPRGSDGD